MRFIRFATKYSDHPTSLLPESIQCVESVRQKRADGISEEVTRIYFNGGIITVNEGMETVMEKIEGKHESADRILRKPLWANSCALCRRCGKEVENAFANNNYPAFCGNCGIEFDWKD